MPKLVEILHYSNDPVQWMNRTLFVDDQQAFFALKLQNPVPEPNLGSWFGIPKPNPQPNSNKHDAESPPKLFRSFGSEKLRVGVVAPSQSAPQQAAVWCLSRGLPAAKRSLRY